MKYLIIKNYNLFSPRYIEKQYKGYLNTVGCDLECNDKSIVITCTDKPHYHIFDVCNDLLEDLCSEDDLLDLENEMMRTKDHATVTFNCDNLKIST